MSILGGVLEVVGEGLFDQFVGLVRIPRPVAWRFKVDIDGVADAGFQSAKGLSDRMTPYRISQVNEAVDMKVFDKRQVGHITLRKGLTFGGKLERWYNETSGFQRGGKDFRRDVSIIQLYQVPQGVPLIGGMMVEMKRWYLSRCKIVDVTYPDFDAMAGGALSILSCTLSPEDIEAVSDAGTFGSLLDAVQRWSSR